MARLEAKLRDENGLDVARGSRVVVTAGGNMAFLNAVLAIADPGDEIILPVPFYFNHDMAIVLAGCRTVPVATRPDYQLDLGALAAAITPRTRAIVTVSPNNPSGAVYPEAALRAVNDLCRERGLFHIHDEAYEYFTYDEPHVSPGAFAGAAGHTISMWSLSKAFGFASWRIGYMTIPEALFDAVNKIQDTNLICPAAVSQHAALAALDVGRPYCDAHVRVLAQVRALVYARLATLGDLVEAPDARGAFYVLLRVKTALDPYVLARTPDPRAQGRDHPGPGVRPHRRLLAAPVLRRAGAGHRRRRDRPPRRGPRLDSAHAGIARAQGERARTMARLSGIWSMRCVAGCSAPWSPTCSRRSRPASSLGEFALQRGRLAGRRATPTHAAEAVAARARRRPRAGPTSPPPTA